MTPPPQMPASLETLLSSEEVFRQLKASCVPLLGKALLTPSSVPDVSNLLSDLITTLRNVQSSGYVLTPSLISYTFFPLSTILRRNAPTAIPDRVLEKILTILGILCERWWWDWEIAVWEQIFMLCGAIVGGIEGKGKGKDRDDETKEAAVQCLWSLLRQREPEEDPSCSHSSPSRTQLRLMELQTYAQTTKFIPILGQTLNSLLLTSESHHMPLQLLSLKVLHVVIALYAPDYFVPSVLPGVVSSMTKKALGISVGRGWANGEVVAGALKVMQVVIVLSVGDKVCVEEGAIREVQVLEDLARLGDELPHPHDATLRPYSTVRTSLWLRGTSSQVHIAINTLTPLISHPTPSALAALSRFSSALLATTPLTLPQSQPLLLSFLLSLSNSEYPTVKHSALGFLSQLLAPSSNARHSLMQTLMQNTRDNLASLPRILPSLADSKVEHVAGLVEAVCRLAVMSEVVSDSGRSSIAGGIGKLLGPTGGIEKFGWSLLSVLEFVNPTVTLSRTSAAQLMLENDLGGSELIIFPEVTFKNVSSRTVYTALVRMFRALGNAAGDSCLYAVEWFTNIGRSGRGPRAIAAFWCASRLLEGVGNITLDCADNTDSTRRSTRVEKFARGLAKGLAELWEDDKDEDVSQTDTTDGNLEIDDAHLPVEHVNGTISIRVTPEIYPAFPAKNRGPAPQPLLHEALALQLLSICAGILQARFNPLLLHTLYPVLRSLVSPIYHLSSTALATLNFITVSTSYTSPSSLLLSNFDYALDAVSRRLTHRWLDVDATKVLTVLVRLVGSDVVQRAGDVVEECFDRLDEFHGYEVIVEGLMEVLGEVIKVIEIDDESARRDSPSGVPRVDDSDHLNTFFKWFDQRHSPLGEGEDCTDYGPPPHEAWGEDKGKANAEAEEEDKSREPDANADPTPTPTQALTKQIVSRSLYFLTHQSPVIRARILTLLSSSVPVLPESSLLPSIHHAWPFVLNRLADPEPIVVSAAAFLVEALATHVGDIMFRRIWDDIWPRFRSMLAKLEAADSTNALARRGHGAVGMESAYTHSHRLYRSLLKTMTAAAKGVPAQDSSVFQVMLAFRRFLNSEAHEELQACGRALYIAIGANNQDAVWLVLSSTTGDLGVTTRFMREHKWDLGYNVGLILNALTNS